jgi:hypothetical protein
VEQFHRTISRGVSNERRVEIGNQVTGYLNVRQGMLPRSSGSTSTRLRCLGVPCMTARYAFRWAIILERRSVGGTVIVR